jgi:hypothetical protein
VGPTLRKALIRKGEVILDDGPGLSICIAPKGISGRGIGVLEATGVGELESSTGTFTPLAVTVNAIAVGTYSAGSTVGKFEPERGVQPTNKPMTIDISRRRKNTYIY